MLWAAPIHSLKTCFNFNHVSQICNIGSVVFCEKEWALYIDNIACLEQLPSKSFFNVIDIRKAF